MPTIKTKKEMNLGELLCWAIDNKEQARFRDFSSKNMRVRFNDSGYPCIEFDKKFLPTYETFKVEIEEPITEDTVFKHMIEVRGSDHTTWNNTSIADEKLPNSTQFYAYIDEGYKLIWRDGKLVE